MVKARILGHPVHPPLTDFPIVLLLGATVCDIAGAVRDSAALWTVGYWSLILGLVASIPTLVTGLLDFMSAPQEANETAYRHLYAVSLMLTCYSTSLVIRWGAAPPVDAMQTIVLVCEALGAILLMAAGWFGGHLVFHHGVGKA